MGLKLIPDFGESDLYIIAVSFIFMFLLYYANSGSIEWVVSEFNNDPDGVAGVGIFVLAMFVLGAILPIRYALSEKMPNEKMQTEWFMFHFLVLHLSHYM